MSEAEHPVAAAVRAQLRQVLEAGPFTTARAGDMARIVETSLSLLRTIKCGRAAARPVGHPGATLAGINTPFGTMPISDLYVDATPTVAVGRTIGIAMYAVRKIRMKLMGAVRDLAWEAAEATAPTDEGKAADGLRDAMKARLSRMLEKPYTIPTALRIERFLAATIPLLQTLGPAADHFVSRDLPVGSSGPYPMNTVASLLEDGVAVAPNPIQPMSLPTAEDEAEELEEGTLDEYASSFGSMSSFGMGTQTSPPNETFGARMIREIMSALPLIMSSQKQTPENMVLAIAAAEREGMPKLAGKLRRIMGLEKPDEQETPEPIMAEPVNGTAP